MSASTGHLGTPTPSGIEEGDAGHQVLVDYVQRTFQDHHEERIAANEAWLVLPLEPEDVD
jgi:hypothetical protein